MQRRMSLIMLAVAMSLVGLAGLALDTVVAPRSLQAQGCGANAGPLCAADCMRECSNGSCCAWLLYYYPQPEKDQ